MPLRPRAHQLEELSRRAFRERLPPAWVTRDLDPDYGLDLLVDIVDESAVVTGRSFYVQLKSSDSAEIGKALALRFKHELAAYYRSLDLPVLIAFLHGPSSRLYAKWFHSYDPHLRRTSNVPSRATATFTFRLVEEDEWRANTPEDLVSDVEAFRRFRSPELGRPVPFNVAGSESVHGLPLEHHVAALRHLAKRLGRAVAIRRAQAVRGLPGITLSDASAVVNMADVASVTIDYESPLGEKDHEAFPKDVLLAMALAFEQIGQTDLAAQIAARFAAESTLIGEPEVTFRVAGCLSRANRIRECLAAADDIDSRRGEADGIVSEILLFPIMANLQTMSPSDLDEFHAVRMRRIERRTRERDYEGAGTEEYNLANHLRTIGQGRAAVRHYCTAARLNRRYRESGYFYRELAGGLYGVGRPAFAAGAYARALSLGERGMTRALYADALLVAGQLNEAEDAFNRYLANAQNPRPEWALKARMVPHLRRRAGDIHTRDPEAATELASNALSAPSLEHAEQALNQALDLDPLCGLAWSHIGLLLIPAAVETGDRSEAARACLTAALLLRTDPAAWNNAAILSWSDSSERKAVPLILETGYRFVGDELESQLIDYASIHLTGQERHEFLDVSARAAEAVERERRGEGFVVRFPIGETPEIIEILPPAEAL